MQLPDFAGQNIYLLFELRSRKLLESAVMVFVSEDRYRDVMLRYTFIQRLVPKGVCAKAVKRSA